MSVMAHFDNAAVLAASRRATPNPAPAQAVDESRDVRVARDSPGLPHLAARQAGTDDCREECAARCIGCSSDHLWPTAPEIEVTLEANPGSQPTPRASAPFATPA